MKPQSEHTKNDEYFIFDPRNKRLTEILNKSTQKYTFFFLINNSIFDPRSLRFSKIVATWLATVEPQIVDS